MPGGNVLARGELLQGPQCGGPGLGRVDEQLVAAGAGHVDDDAAVGVGGRRRGLGGGRTVVGRGLAERFCRRAAAQRPAGVLFSFESYFWNNFRLFSFFLSFFVFFFSF